MHKSRKKSAATYPTKDNFNNLSQKADKALRDGLPNIAIDLYIGFLKKNPSNFLAKSNLGLAYFHVSNFQKAYEIFKELFDIAPEDPAILNRLGVTSLKLGLVLEAEKLLLKASTINPNRYETWINLCYVAGTLRQFKEGIIYAMRAVEINPKSEEAFINLGSSLMVIGKYDAALIAFNTVLDIKKDNLLALCNIGSIYSQTGKSLEAIEAFEACIKIHPDHPHCNMVKLYLATEYLHMGRLEEGWKYYDYGFGEVGSNGRNPCRKFSIPLWNGDALPDKKLLVWREQGLGDEIMFLSCIPQALEICPNLIIESDSRLVTLLQRSFPYANVRSQSCLPPPALTSIHQDFDFHLPAGSLMRYFRNSLDDFKNSKPYLIADETLSERYKRRLGSDQSKLRVGICWRSGMLDVQRNKNYTPLSAWHEILKNKNCVFVNLQYDKCENEISNANDEFGNYINNWPDVDLKNDLESVAAIISGLDLVISAGTAVAQMAAALGVPVFLFTPDNAENWTNFGLDYYAWYENVSLFKFPDGQPEVALREIACQLNTRILSHDPF